MFRQIVKAILRAIASVLFRVRVEGRIPSPLPQRLLVIANHESFLDGLLLGLYLPVNPVFVVHTSVVRHPLFRLVLSLTDYLTVDPANPMAMKRVVRLLESGRPVVIFPEGRITTTGSLMKTYDGPAFVAARTGAQILPVRIDGAARTYFSRLGGKFPRRLLPQISLYIQPLTHIAMPDAPFARERRRLCGEEMRRIMQRMIFAGRPQQTIFAAMLDAISIHGRSHRLVEDAQQREYSYGELLKMTLALGRLVARESGDGETVGLLLPNATATLALALGLPAFRRTPAMLNYSAGIEAMQASCQAANVRTVVTSRAFIVQGRLQDKLEALAQDRKVLYLEDLRAGMTLGDRLWLVLFAQWFARTATWRGTAEDQAVILFTSGSEGLPKGVVLSHRALLANVAQVRAAIAFSVEDKILNALPLFHSFGLTAGGLLPVLTGAGVFLYPSPLHYRQIPELAYDRGCTALLGTSTFLGNYAKHAHPYDFYRLRYVVAGAEKLSDAVREQWIDKFGLRIFEGYGATETAPVMAVNTPMAYRRHTVGQMLPGMEVQLREVPGMEPPPPGARRGMLYVRGPNLMSGYLRQDNPGVLEPVHSEIGAGWYETGDVVQINSEGFVSIVGRVRRFAKIAGEMVSLEVAEKIAIQASPAAQHAVVSVPDAGKGEALVLFTTDKNLARDMLAAAAAQMGASELAIARRIRVIDALPLLGTGKTDYVTLNRMLTEAQAA